MKKSILWSAMLLFACVGFTSCSDDDDNGKTPNPEAPSVSEGAFVLNQGNMGNKIEGSLTYLDYATGMASQNVYQNANGQSLGNTPQCAVPYGSKIYLGIYESNVITVIDNKTFKTIKQISLNANEGQSPRSLVAKDGKVYISMYNGYVSRLDTLSLAIDGNVKVGPNPEIIAIAENKLYVPNSDGMNWQGKYANGLTASVIDIPSFKVVKTIAVGLNPTKFCSNGKDVFLLCMGNYNDVKSKIYQLLSDDSLKEIAEANLMDVKDNKLYMINAPYGVSTVQYTVYNINNSSVTDMLSDEGVDAPAALAVDPVSGKIIITSNPLDNGNISYSLAGYAKEYDANGQFVRRYNVGVGPAVIFFNLN